MSEHSSFSKDKARDGFCEVVAKKNGKLPIKAFTWLITHFSRAGVYVAISFPKMSFRDFTEKRRNKGHVRCQRTSHVQDRRTTEK